MEGEVSNKIEGSEKSTVKPTRLQQLNEYSNLIVGIATVLLVIVTAIYISLSMKIANETKRLADITVEQFKIKSYPTILITRGTPTYENGNYKDEIKIANYGEISSFETKVAIFYAGSLLDKNMNMSFKFVLDWSTFFVLENAEKVNTLDYSVKIRSMTSRNIEITGPIRKGIFDSIKYQLIIVRNKVPYDTSYNYETYAYGLERKEEYSATEKITLRWENLPDSNKEALIDNLFEFDVIATNMEEKLIDFFIDYPNYKPLKFYKKE